MISQDNVAFFYEHCAKTGTLDIFFGRKAKQWSNDEMFFARTLLLYPTEELIDDELYLAWLMPFQFDVVRDLTESLEEYFVCTQ